jgi:hypothetical protein
VGWQRCKGCGGRRGGGGGAVFVVTFTAIAATVVVANLVVPNVVVANVATDAALVASDDAAAMQHANAAVSRIGERTRRHRERGDCFGRHGN